MLAYLTGRDWGIARRRHRSGAGAASLVTTGCSPGVLASGRYTGERVSRSVTVWQNLDTGSP